MRDGGSSPQRNILTAPGRAYRRGQAGPADPAQRADRLTAPTAAPTPARNAPLTTQREPEGAPRGGNRHPEIRGGAADSPQAGRQAGRRRQQRPGRRPPCWGECACARAPRPGCARSPRRRRAQRGVMGRRPLWGDVQGLSQVTFCDPFGDSGCRPAGERGWLTDTRAGLAGNPSPCGSPRPGPQRPLAAARRNDSGH